MARVAPILGGLSFIVTSSDATKYLAMESSKFCCATLKILKGISTVHYLGFWQNVFIQNKPCTVSTKNFILILEVKKCLMQLCHIFLLVFWFMLFSFSLRFSNMFGGDCILNSNEVIS